MKITYNPIVSIIIPIYNASLYLARCLNSIVSQTYTDWELLLVDDGSTDGSSQICDEYQQKDSRIKVFHKDNEGVSLSRQYGLDRVNTPFFIYCDADDYVEPNYLECMINVITTKDADISVCQYIEEYGDRTVVQDISNSSSPEMLIKDFLEGRLWGVTWNKLYKTEIVRNAGIKFIPNLQMWEDLAFTIDYCLHIKKVVFVQNPLYHYVMYNDGSITKKEDFKKKNDRIIAIRHIENSFDMLGYKDVFHDVLVKEKYNVVSVTYKGKDEIRRNYYLNAFPEIWKDPFLKESEPLAYYLVKWHLERLLYVGYLYNEVLNCIRKNVKRVFRR